MPATLEPWAPALAQTAPPIVPGMASPNSSPERPASWVTVAARAIGSPASAISRPSATSAPSARSWITMPRKPASAMTTLLPRPRRRCGMSRLRTNLRRPRSSNPLWTTAKRSAGPPTRIVVNRASGSSRDVLTPIRRWISVPSAIASNLPGSAAVPITRGSPAWPRRSVRSWPGPATAPGARPPAGVPRPRPQPPAGQGSAPPRTCARAWPGRRGVPRHR